MKRIYRCFVLMLAVLAAASLCVTGALADGGPQIIVGGAESATPGSTIEVPVSLANNPGINTFTLTVDYDHTRLSLTNAAQNASLGGTFFYTANTETVSWQAGSDTTYSGTAFTLTFNVLDNAPLGAASVTITYTQGNICNFDEDDVNFTVVPASVTVSAAPHDHAWGEGDVTTAPTCEGEGERTYTCSVCGETKTEAVGALGHDFSGEVAASTPASCLEAATETRKCVRFDDCGETETKTIGRPTGHDYAVVTTPATCTEDGQEVSTCKNCAAGTEGHKVIKTLPKTGHKYDEGVVTTEATCTQKGVKTFTCVNDGCAAATPDHSKTEEIPMKPHTKPDDASQIEHVDATAAADGYDKYVCTVCGNEVTDTIKYEKPAADSEKDGKTAGKKSSPQTGDESGVAVWAALLIVCTAAAAVIAVRKPHKS